MTSSKIGASQALDKSMVYFPDINIDINGRNTKYDDTDMTYDDHLDDQLSFRLMDTPSNLHKGTRYGDFEKFLDTQRKSNKTIQFPEDEFDSQRLQMYRPRQNQSLTFRKKIRIQKSNDSNESDGSKLRLCQQNSSIKKLQTQPEFITKQDAIKMMDLKLKQQKRYLDQKLKILEKVTPLPFQ